MRYRLLNEILINWRNFSKKKDDSVIKVSDIKQKLSQYFIYELDNPGHIKIFSGGEWKPLPKFKDKVYVDGEHVKLNLWSGYTETKHEAGKHKIYIEDIDEVDDCRYMFYYCEELKSVPLFDTSKVTNMAGMFEMCTSLETVPLFNTKNVSDMGYMFHNCCNLKSVPLFNTENIIFESQLSNMFQGCTLIDDETKRRWGHLYNFNFS